MLFPRRGTWNAGELTRRVSRWNTCAARRDKRLILLNGLGLLIENPQLTKTGHPILCVPGANNFAVFEFVDIDNLNVHFPVLGRKTHKRFLLSASHSGANHDLAPVLENVLDRKFQIRKRACQLREKRFCTFRPSGGTGLARNINPSLVLSGLSRE